jgi:hypothetical protein
MNEENAPRSVLFEDLLKPQEAARMLTISKSHLRELTLTGRIPVIDMGNASKHMWRYHAPSIDSWLQEEMRVK